MICIQNVIHDFILILFMIFTMSKEQALAQLQRDMIEEIWTRNRLSLFLPFLVCFSLYFFLHLIPCTSFIIVFINLCYFAILLFLLTTIKF